MPTEVAFTQREEEDGSPCGGGEPLATCRDRRASEHLSLKLQVKLFIHVGLCPSRTS